MLRMIFAMVHANTNLHNVIFHWASISKYVSRLKDPRELQFLVDGSSMNSCLVIHGNLHFRVSQATHLDESIWIIRCLEQSLHDSCPVLLRIHALGRASSLSPVSVAFMYFPVFKQRDLMIFHIWLLPSIFKLPRSDVKSQASRPLKSTDNGKTTDPHVPFQAQLPKFLRFGSKAISNPVIDLNITRHCNSKPLGKDRAWSDSQLLISHLLSSVRSLRSNFILLSFFVASSVLKG